MKIKELGEFGLISRLMGAVPSHSENVVRGAGDDAAVLRAKAGQLTLITTDMLVEEVHFSLRYCPLRSIGWKALAVNVSDIAAMGGVPTAAVISVGIPQHMEVEQIEQIYQGLGDCAAEYGVDIVGGDTVRSPDRLVINAALLGWVEPANVKYRSGAGPGDYILVTGPLGNSAAGLHILHIMDNGLTGDRVENFGEAVRSHLYPRARVREGRILGGSGYVTSMNDISDGLASEVLEICMASGTGCELEAAKVPYTGEMAAISQKAGVSPMEWALYGGEDFELVFTVNQPGLDLVIAMLKQAGCPPAVIGRITEPENGCLLVDKKGKTALTAGGYNHFRE